MAKRHPPNGIPMFQGVAEWLARLRVPKKGSLIQTGAGDCLTVGAPCQAIDPGRMPEEYLRSLGGIPIRAPNLPLYITGQYRFAIRTKGHRPDWVGVGNGLANGLQRG